MTSQQDNQQSEINVLEFFSSIWKGVIHFFKNVLDILLFLFVFGIRRFIWLTLALFIGIGIGYLVYLQTPRYYSSEMIAQPNGFNSIEMGQYINDIHSLCEHNNVEGIQQALDMSLKNAELIKDIEAFYLIDVNRDGIGDYVDYNNKYDPEDTTKTVIKSRLVIRAQVYDNKGFADVKLGLVNYIDNNPYLIKVNDIRKRELEAQIANAEEEIRKLDSLQNFEYYSALENNNLNRNGQIVFLNEKLTQLYYRDKESLLNKRLDYQKALELATDPITIIKDFTPLQTQDNPVTGYIIKGGLISFIIAFLLLLYITYRIKIRDFLSLKA